MKAQYYLVTWGIGKPYGQQQKCSTKHQAEMVMKSLEKNPQGFEMELYVKYTTLQPYGGYWKQLI
jgi:hypothetical protein